MSVLEEIAAERRRQIEAEGWTAEHDDQHTDGSLAAAAAAYAWAASLSDHARAKLADVESVWGWQLWRLWPRSWAGAWCKPRDRRRDLVRAAALIVAEIERLDRAAARGKAGGDDD